MAVLGLVSSLHALAPSSPLCPTADPCAALAGRVQRAGERQPVPGASVLVTASPPGARPGRAHAPIPASPPWIARAVTDADGRFVVPAVPRANVRVVVIVEGYAREDRVVDAGNGRALRLFVRPSAEAEYRTVVRAETDAPPAAPPVAHRLEDEELRTIPGSRSDALRGAQALPGFARPPFGFGLVVLRGAPPSQSTVMLGEHPVRRAFHALPLAAIVPTGAMDALEIVPSNYSARYGPGSAGLVRIDPRRGRRDGHHGHAEIDLIAAGGAQEGPLGRGSYLLGGRNGHVGPVLGVIERIDGVGTFPRPTFWDYHGVIGGPVARGIDLHAAVYGAGDRVEQRAARTPSAATPLLTFRGQMHRPSLTLVGKAGRTRVMASTALLVASESFTLPRSSDVRRRDLQPSWRFEVQSRPHESATFLLGTDGVVVRRHTELATHRVEGYEDGEPEIVREVESGEGTDTSIGLFAIVELRFGPVQIVPGTRLQTFTAGRASAPAFDPRLAIEIAPADRWRVHAAAGVYSQPRLTSPTRSSNFIEEALGPLAPRVVLPATLTENFEPQIPYESESFLALRRALHVSGGPEVDLPLDMTLGVTAFARMHEAGGSTERLGGGLLFAPLRREQGIDAGGELLLRKHLTRRLYGWIAYTVMKSVMKDDRRTYPGDFDQRHNLSVVASYGLPGQVRIGARFQLVSGTPFTPIAAVEGIPQADLSGEHRPESLLFGPTNSARMPTFHQLDLRLDKRWILARASITFYVDVQNVYNRENTDIFVHEWDFTETFGSIGLPIFPSLGLGVEW